MFEISYAVLCTVWFFFILVWARPSGRPAFFIFSLFSLLSIVIPVMTYEITGSREVLASGIDSIYLIDESIKIGLIGLVGVFFGYVFREIVWQTPTRLHGNPHLLNKKYFEFIRRLNIGIFGVIFLIYVVNPLGPVGFIEAGFRRLPLEGFIFSFLYSLNVVVSVTTLLIFVECQSRRVRPPYVQIIASVGLFWILGGRVQFIITLLPYLLALGAAGRLTAWKLALAIIFAGSLSVVTLLLRYQVQGTQSLSFSAALATFASQFELLSGYNIAASYTQVYGNDPLLYGKFLMQVIPRAIFPDKPEQLTSFLRYFIKGDDLGGLTVGLFGEFFVAFGFVGCAVCGAIYGYGLSKLDAVFRSQRIISAVTKAYCYVMIGIATAYVMRGGVDSSVFRLSIVTVVWLSLLLGLKLTTLKVRGRHAGSRVSGN